jgi:hypothetical protein
VSCSCIDRSWSTGCRGSCGLGVGYRSGVVVQLHWVKRRGTHMSRRRVARRGSRWRRKGRKRRLSLLIRQLIGLDRMGSCHMPGLSDTDLCLGGHIRRHRVDARQLGGVSLSKAPVIRVLVGVETWDRSHSWSPRIEGRLDRVARVSSRFVASIWCVGGWRG